MRVTVYIASAEHKQTSKQKVSGPPAARKETERAAVNIERPLLFLSVTVKGHYCFSLAGRVESMHVFKERERTGEHEGGIERVHRPACVYRRKESRAQ